MSSNTKITTKITTQTTPSGGKIATVGRYRIMDRAALDDMEPATPAPAPASAPAPARPSQHRRDYMRNYVARRREGIRARAVAMIQAGSRAPRFTSDPELYHAYMIARRRRERAEARQ